MTTDQIVDATAAANASAARAAARAWTAALACPPPPPPSAAAASLLRRLGIAKLVREQWKKKGIGGSFSDEEPAAWFDGRVDALEAFVSEAISGSEEDEDDEESVAIDVIENGGQVGREGGLAALFAAQRLLPGLQRPALLLGAAGDWRCSRLWSKNKEEDVKKPSSPSSFPPDWDAFASSFPAGEQARITDGRRKGARPDVRKKVEVSEAVRLVQEFERRRDEGGGRSDGDGAACSDGGDETPDAPLPYLKDLQCSQAHPRGLLDDAAPAWASGDEWLGDGADSWAGERASGRGRGDDDDEEEKSDGNKAAAPAHRRPPSYRFVYAGPMGASTPWHADVYGSCAWSANISGWKKWTFLPPHLAPLLYSRFGEETAKWFGGEEEEEEEDGPSSVSFPWLGEARRRARSVLQGPGDAVFVPPAWWHCVENVFEPQSDCPRLGGGGGEEPAGKPRGGASSSAAAASISINVNFVAGPVAAAAAWEDSVLREHEEELRRKVRGEEEEEGRAHDENDEAGSPRLNRKQQRHRRRRLASSLPPLPPLPARQVDGSTLASPPAEGIGIGGFVALALGAAERAARLIEEEEEERRGASKTAAAAKKLNDPLSAVALARAAVSARSARRVLLGAADYARRAASATLEEDGEDEDDMTAAAAERFLEGLTLAELQVAADRASAAVEAAAELLGVQAQL